jgi:uncharacterized damage-inducible protein DinB
MATGMTPAFTPEIARAHLEITLKSLEYEAAATRSVIAAITDPGFRIDPKSRTAIEIAWHIVVVEVAFLDQLADMKFSDDSNEPPHPPTPPEIVKWHESNLLRACARLRALTNEQLLTLMNFFGVFNFPIFMYPDFAKSHSIHHRAQLATCLRPMGSKVPQIYGGSADNPMQM